MRYKKHIRRSFASDFSRDARAGNIMPQQSSDLEIEVRDNEQCTYWNECRQIKRNICRTNYEDCIIYQRMKVLDLRSKTGLERFIERYGENWREMFI